MIYPIIATGARARWLILLFFFVALPAHSDCGPGPDGFEVWPAEEPVPVASIPRAHWYRDVRGWIIAPDRCQASDAALERQAAVQAFRRYFDRPAPSGAIVDVGFAASMAALTEAGVGWMLPWRFATRDATSMGDEQVAAIRRQVEEQLAGGGATPDPAQVDAIVEQAVAALSGADSEAGTTPLAELEPTAVRHEVAHSLFIHAIWPADESAGSQYGGGAPDWLDEAAAVAAESPAMTEARRREFRAAAAEKRLIPLSEYFAMPHPASADSALGDLLERTKAAAARDGVAVMSMEIDDATVARASLFYAQTRGLLDYLEMRAGGPTVLADIADALRAGADIRQWLKASGARAGLPATVESLGDDFRGWAESDASALTKIGVNSG